MNLNKTNSDTLAAGQPQYIYRRIGGTSYKVKVVFSGEARETMEDKILRLVRNSSDTNGETCDIMNPSQMSRQSERSAS